MSKLNDGGPAYPVHPRAVPASATFSGPEYCAGMSLRDWFAGQALPAAFAKVEAGLTDYERCHIFNKKRDQLGGETQQQMTAALAYSYADAMLAERTKERSS